MKNYSKYSRSSQGSGIRNLADYGYNSNDSSSSGRKASKYMTNGPKYAQENDDSRNRKESN